MSKQEKKGLFPERRFPEFRNSEGWEGKKLIDTANKKVKWSFIGGPFGSNLKSSDYVESGIRVIQLQNIGDAEFRDDYKIFTSEEKANELLSNNIYPGDIILSKMGDPVGRACLIPNTHNRYVMCSDGIRLVVDEKKYSKYFIYSLINSVQFRSLVEKTATGSTRKRIGLDDLKNLPMRIPTERNEQQKIADCLTSVDELITAQTQKLDVITTHKKGLMQQLFPAKGETVPKRRFPEFRGDWILKTGEEITSKITKGSSPSWQGFSYQSEGVLFITSENVRDGFLDVSSPKYLPKEFYEKQKNSQLCYGDILINIVGASIGRNCLYLLDREAFTNQAVALFRVDNKNSFEFISYCYQHDRIQSEVAGSQSDSARPNLSLTDLRNMKFILPSLPEQQKIADCLASVDELITNQAKKVEALKAHKKGLMQQLFPAMDDDCTDAGGTSPRMDKGRATQEQEQLPRATQDAKTEVST